MPLISKVNINDFSFKRDAAGIENVLEYVESQKSPMFMIFFLVKDNKDNTAKVMTSMVKKDKDKTYKEQIEKISQRSDFYQFLVPGKDNLSVKI